MKIAMVGAGASDGSAGASVRRVGRNASLDDHRRDPGMDLFSRDVGTDGSRGGGVLLTPAIGSAGLSGELRPPSSAALASHPRTTARSGTFHGVLRAPYAAEDGGP